ncbi:alpha-amylase/4-alpha-glucanotransferase domain-containing protein [Hydrogenimonas thermophila]|uniref:alpha-amylase/4-alpha-glucanotransferase domain-containing protein n=1 Tax=Hydrogenimonas thermophila TaxID=223786 RepID=UPI002936FD90|nr:alpha-amylase/4-alpha-glucanotransferase domain-containing protein [Hydrogenimonas thermophila]WOE69195.1 alpha-amylase/4-alpha-glucanotransferase domain-containing protein [Hydrogenimonas thermophila]WOE71705.1 alpha-amylase/4-alpha-glucanotransferase domain-containing protein [Hydrogenimonas thermophila]
MRKESIALLFGVHMHQPVDNFKETIDRAVETCYAPFFALMCKFPEFRFSVHCSGWLLETIEQNYPELFADMQWLAKEGSIELFTAGFYEPILSAIPSKDRIAQIKRLNCSIKRFFKQKPQGLWLTERIWEAGLIPDLVKAGIKYSIVDDYHFISAGFDKDRLDGYYNTEESGESIALFPISQELRYALPFKPVDEAIRSIKSSVNSADGSAIIFDDVEKFGLWRKTHHWVYEQGWLEEFIEAVLSDESINTMHFGEYFHLHRPKGIAYLPNVSYYEMGEWSLKASDSLQLKALKEQISDQDAVKFLKGGIWKNFFVKYEESNRLHKRMIEISKVRTKKSDFLENLYALQTNDLFWHGIFGGIYLPHLRDNAYRYLINCENIRYAKKVAIECADIDLDGYDEVKMVQKEVIMRFDSRYGGQLIEFDDRKSAFNFQNVLTRRKEAYHKKILESESGDHSSNGTLNIHNSLDKVEEDLKDALVYDWYLKNSFIDHISDHTLDLKSFIECDFREFSDFTNQPFDVKIGKKRVLFERYGGIFDNQTYPSHLKKSYRPLDNGVDFKIELKSESPHIYEYGLELNLHFANLKDVHLNQKVIGDGMRCNELKEFTLSDPYTKRNIIFSLDHFFSLFALPLKTLSQSEDGYELMTQGVSLMVIIPFKEQLRLKGSLEVVK